MKSETFNWPTRLLVAVPLGALLLAASYVSAFVGLVMLLLVTNPQIPDAREKWVDDIIVPIVFVSLAAGVIIPWLQFVWQGRLIRSLLLASLILAFSYMIMFTTFVVLA